MNIYLDCGFYVGGALKKMVKARRVNRKTLIYAFEPNPTLEVDRWISEQPYKINLIKKAVWIKDGKMKFHIGGRDDAASLKGTTGHADFDETSVETIDFPKFVAGLPDLPIVCSMDIEGAEYTVLEKMIEDGSINRIQRLDIEFHHRFMNHKDKTHSKAIIDQLKARGIQVKLKVPLS